MKIEAKDVRVVPISSLNLNPKNRNQHPEEQIKRLSEIISYQGFRQPVVVSNRSGLVVAGHGRLEAARLLGMKDVPALFQDFENEDQEYAFGVSDNAIAAWAELDLSGINSDLGDLGPDFDLEMLGINDFTLEPLIQDEKTKEKDAGGKPKEIECPNCGEIFSHSPA